MKIFVLHYSKLVDRKTHILEQFKKHNITDYEFIEAFDKDEIMDVYTLKFKKISLGSTSLSLKHHLAYKKIAEEHDTALIFEDDVVLTDNFLNIFNTYIAQLPEDYDMLFIGNGCNLHIQKHTLVQGKFVYDKCLEPTSWGGNGATRCTDSYVVSKKCASALCKYIDTLPYKIELPIDWWLNVACRDNKFKVLWAEPTIVRQGTEIGLFKQSY